MDPELQKKLKQEQLEKIEAMVEEVNQEFAKEAIKRAEAKKEKEKGD